VIFVFDLAIFDFDWFWIRFWFVFFFDIYLRSIEVQDGEEGLYRYDG